MRFTETLKNVLSRGGLSSDRVNRLIIVLNYVPVGLAVTFTIIYQTIYRIGGVQWTELSYFMGSLGVFYGAILVTKAVTQSQENKTPTP
jgi:hypothetical protein